MKKHIKFYELLLVCLIMLLGFLNPTIADITTLSAQNSGVNDGGTTNSTVNGNNTVGGTTNNSVGSGNTSGNTTNNLRSGNTTVLGSGNTGGGTGSTGNNSGGSTGNNTTGGGNVYVAGEPEMLDPDDIIDDDVLSQSSHTDLSTVVPATIDVVIIGPGSVANGGKIYGNNNRFKTTDMTFKMSPIEGYQIGEVYWNSVDVTAKVKSGVLKLSEIQSGVLKVRFVPIPVEENQEEEQCCCKKCKGKCKCKSCCCVSTADNIDMAYYFAMAMFLSVIVFLLALDNERICVSASEGRRYRKRTGYPKYKRLRV